MKATATVLARVEDQRLSKAVKGLEFPSFLQLGLRDEEEERKERRRVMGVTSVVKKVEQYLTCVPVVGELRISTSQQCSRCGSRRKTLVASLGWICTICFDRCKEEAEKLVVERNALYRIPEAYKRAIRSYSELSLA
jgi:hypothetical protein